jgi:glycosyltransferase 2 family protein
MRAHIRTVIVLALSLGMLAWFLRGANLRDVWTEIQAGRVGLLLFAVGVTGMTYFFRALRWQYLLRPLGSPPFSLVFKTTVIGFAVSTLLPARAGEVVRPYLLARRAGFSATSAFATIILERLLDLVTVLLLFGFYLAFYDPGASAGHAATYAALKSGGLLAAIGSVAGLIFMMVVSGHPEKLASWALRVERVLPSKVANAMAQLVRTFLEGLAVVRQPRRLAVAGLLSLPLWLSIALGIWSTSRAFHIDMSYPGAFLMMAVLVVGVAVPTPGAVGGFHKAYQIGAVAFFGVANDRAVGAALVLHAISFVPVTIAGAIFLAQEGLSLSGVRGIAAPGVPGDAA